MHAQASVVQCETFFPAANGVCKRTSQEPLSHTSLKWPTASWCSDGADTVRSGNSIVLAPRGSD